MSSFTRFSKIFGNLRYPGFVAGEFTIFNVNQAETGDLCLDGQRLSAAAEIHFCDSF